MSRRRPALKVVPPDSPHRVHPDTAADLSACLDILEHYSMSAEMHGGFEDPEIASRNLCLLTRVMRQIVEHGEVR